MKAYLFTLLLLLAACSTEQPVEEYGHPLAQGMPSELIGPIVFQGRADGHWTNPGSHPFTGDVNSALIAVGVINEAERNRLASRIAHAEYDDTVCASRAGIMPRHGPGFFYAPNMAMTFDSNVVVFNMLVNFKGMQCGLLYIEGGFHIWVPLVCGNITRLAPAFEADRYANSERPDVIAGGPGRGRIGRLVYRLRGGGGIGDRRGQPYQPLPKLPTPQFETQTVPEPSVLALLATGVAMLLYLTKRRKP